MRESVEGWRDQYADLDTEIAALKDTEGFIGDLLEDGLITPEQALLGRAAAADMMALCGQIQVWIRRRFREVHDSFVVACNFCGDPYDIDLVCTSSAAPGETGVQGHTCHALCHLADLRDNGLRNVLTPDFDIATIQGCAWCDGQWVGIDGEPFTDVLRIALEIEMAGNTPGSPAPPVENFTCSLPQCNLQYAPEIICLSEANAAGHTFHAECLVRIYREHGETVRCVDGSPCLMKDCANHLWAANTGDTVQQLIAVKSPAGNAPPKHDTEDEDSNEEVEGDDPTDRDPSTEDDSCVIQPCRKAQTPPDIFCLSESYQPKHYFHTECLVYASIIQSGSADYKDYDPCPMGGCPNTLSAMYDGDSVEGLVTTELEGGDAATEHDDEEPTPQDFEYTSQDEDENVE